MYDPTVATPMSAAELTQALQSHVTTFTNKDFSHQELSFYDSGITTTGLVFENCCFDGASISGGPGFTNCTWNDCSMQSFLPTAVSFSECTLSSCRFGVLDGRGFTIFHRVSGGSWQGSVGALEIQQPSTVEFRDCNLSGSRFLQTSSCTFSDCQLDTAHIGSSDSLTLTRCSLREAMLSSSFTQASWSQCSLISAQLPGLMLSGRVVACDFSGASLVNTTLTGAALPGGEAGGFYSCSFAAASLVSARLAGTFEACNFNGADLLSASAQHDQANPTVLRRCSFISTDLQSCTLQEYASESLVPGVELHSPGTSNGGTVTGRVSNCGDPRLVTVSLLTQGASSSGPWVFASSGVPRADGSFLLRAPEGQGWAQVALVVCSGEQVYWSSHLPTVSVYGRGVLALAQASTVPSDQLALELGASRPQVACPPLDADFTLSGWLTFPDPEDASAPRGAVTLFSLGGAGAGLLAVALPDGAVRLSLASGEAEATLLTAPTLLRNGSWHHVALVRRAGALAVILDGLPLDATGSGTADAPLGGSGALLRLGWCEQDALPDGTPLADLVGALDELQLRAVGQRAVDVRQCMYLPPADGGSLLGWWSFNRRSGAPSAPEGAGTIAPRDASQGALSFTDQTLPFTPDYQPYLVVQQQLLRDVGYAPDDPSKTPAEIPAYHVVMGVRSPVDLPQWVDLEVALAELPEGMEAVAVLRNETLLSLTMEPTTFTVNSQGTLSLVIPPIRGALLAPMLRVRASFMAANEWLVIAPDRHLHWKLSQLTPAALQQGRTVPEDVANAFAPAIAALASGCYEHDLASNHPVVRASDGAGDVRVQSPPNRRYEDPEVTHSTFDPSTQVSTSELVTGSGDVRRVAQLESLDVPHFALECVEGQWRFHPLDEARGTQALARVSTPGGGTLAERFPARARRVPSGSARQELDVDASPVTLSALCDAARTTQQLVVTRRSLVDEDTGARVSTLVAMAELPEGGGWVYGVLTTVPQLMALTQTLCMRVQALSLPQEQARAARPRMALVQDGRGSVTRFGFFADMELVWDLADAFDWDAITATFQVVWNFIDQGVDWMKGQLDDVLVWLKAQLQGMRGWLDAQLDALSAKLGSDTVKAVRKTGSKAAPLPVSASKLQRALGDNASDLDMGLPSPRSGHVRASPLNTGAIATALKAACASFGSVSALTSEALSTVLRVCKGVLDGTVEALEGVLDLIRGLVDTVFDLLDSALDTHIDIPVITWLYEHWLMRGEDHHTLKGKSLLSLLVAVPFTLLGTLGKGKPPFGSDSDGHKVTDAIHAIPDYLRANSVADVFDRIPSFSGSSLASLAAQPAPRQAGAQDARATEAWSIFGSVATTIVGVGVGASGLCALFPQATVQTFGVVAGTVAGLFGAPMWSIATTSTPLQWVSFGLDIGAWAVSSVLPVLLDWLMMVPGVANTFCTAVLRAVPIGSQFERLWKKTISELNESISKLLGVLSLLMSLPKAVMGLIGLGLAIAADVVLLVDNQLPSTDTKMVADVLYNLGVALPGVTLVIVSVLSDGLADSEPAVVQEGLSAAALIPLGASGGSYVLRAGMMAGGT